MLTVIGCGNANRSDDAVGVRVAQRLAARLEKHPVPGVQVFDCGTAGMEVMYRARGSDALAIVDASQLGSEPGAVYEVPGDELEEDFEPAFNLHDFRWQHAIAAGRKIFGDAFPGEVKVWLVEAADLSLGLELTPAVEKGADRVYHRLLEVVAQHALQRHAHERGVTVALRRGQLLLPGHVFDRFFDGRQGALVVERDDRLLLVPVEPELGGLLLKQRNQQGDRVVDASEFLRNHGWDDSREALCAAEWDASLGGLAVELPSRG